MSTPIFMDNTAKEYTNGHLSRTGTPDAKEYLSRAYKLDQQINSKLEHVTSLRSLATRATATYTAQRVSGTSMRCPLENAVCRLVDLEREIDRDIDRLVDLKREMIMVIRQVKRTDLRMLLELRYLSGKTWESISKTLDYDLRWLYRLHGKALLEVHGILTDDGR